jgi:hypothetical protein
MGSGSMIEDSLRLEELPDGKYKLVWDPEDPNYFFLNDMTDEQVTYFMKMAFKEFITNETLEELAQYDPQEVDD